MERVQVEQSEDQVEGCHQFILEILILRIKPRKCLKSYTYIHFSREHSSVFYLSFSIFLSNQMYTISNIYNLQGITLHINNYNGTINCNLLLYFLSKI